RARRGSDRPHPRRARGDPLGARRDALREPTRAVTSHGTMVDGKRVAVVVPAYNEETLIAETVNGMPGFVDRIYVVDDASRDETAVRARELTERDARVQVIAHDRNRGVGAAIVTGYMRAIEEAIDVTAVMAADNQMDPDDLQMLVAPVARGEVDYAKAN